MSWKFSIIDSPVYLQEKRDSWINIVLQQIKCTFEEKQAIKDRKHFDLFAKASRELLRWLNLIVSRPNFWVNIKFVGSFWNLKKKSFIKNRLFDYFGVSKILDFWGGEGGFFSVWIPRYFVIYLNSKFKRIETSLLKCDII